MRLPAAGLQCIVKPFGGGAGGPGSQIGGGNQTIGGILELPADALWARFRFTCWSPEDVPVADAAYAATSMIGDGYAAYDEDGAVSEAGWRAVGFGGGRRSCVAQAAGSGGGERGFVLPGMRRESAAGFEAGLAVSDWMPVTPVRRRHGGVGALINLRIYVPEGTPPFRLGYAATPALEVAVAGSYSFGNNAVAPFGGVGHGFPVSVVHGVDVVCASPTRTLIVVGDSIGSGDYSSGSGTSYGLAAALALTRRGVPMTAAVLANPLQTTRCFIGNGYRFIGEEAGELGGSVIVIQCWSSNDAATVAQAEEGFRTALALTSFCMGQGITPILATGAPVFGNAPEKERCRSHANELARSSGLLCLDIDRIVGAGTTPNSYAPGFGAWDNVHLGDAGQLAVAERLTQMIAGLLPALAG